MSPAKSKLLSRINIPIKVAFYLCITCFLYTTSYSQTTKIAGFVVDTSAKVPLVNASVVLLQAKDSFIVSDVRADKNGRFEFKNLNDTAQYVLFFSYPKYVSYSYKADMKNAVYSLYDMKKISLMLKSRLLEEVIVKSRVSAIKIKGDTTEYTADSFKVQANANVEDLLKQLPGLQVDQYGNITAQGQKVKKVLVDGEEFFSTDPTLVTRNLRADMIDKVQVYDKKSDAAAFTGIEDGVKDKTINLKIKEDKNHGIFGKIDAGAGTDKHYNGQGMLNAFKGKRKMAVFATTGNIGRTGLGSADKEKVGSDEEGDGTYSGKGIPTISSAGLHYDKKWDADKHFVNGNYKYNQTNIAGEQNTISQNNLSTGIILSESNSFFNNSSTKNNLNAEYTYKPDTTSTFKIYSDGSLFFSKNENKNNSVNKRGDGTTLYNNASSGANDYGMNHGNINLSWQKKLKKYGRTVSFYFNNNFSEDYGNGENISTSEFFNTQNVKDSTAVLHLKRKMNDNWHTHNFNTVYTEPLSSRLSLILNYTLYNEGSRDDKRSYDLAKNNSGSIIDSNFSTFMNASVLSNEAGAFLNYNYKKTTIKVGNNIKILNMDAESLLESISFKKQFTNLSPTANFTYRFSNYKNLQLNYNGANNNPTRTQLLPYRYNNGQLTTYLPNLQLKNSFTNNFSGNYYTYKVVTQTYFGVNASYSISNNPITLGMTVNPSGSYNYQYVNMNGYANQNLFTSIAYSRKIQKWDVQAWSYFNVFTGKNFSIINDAVNKLNNSTYTLNTGVYKTKLKKYEIYLNGSGGYTINKSSLQPDIKNNYFFYTISPVFDVYFLKKFQIHTDANYFWQQKTQAFNDNFKRLIWNAWLGRNFLKNDQLTVKISCNDILNQNNGYSRSASNTFFSEERYTTIRRFFMIGATWSFTKFNNIKQ